MKYCHFLSKNIYIWIIVILLSSCNAGQDECIPADDFGNYAYSNITTVSAFPPDYQISADELLASSNAAASQLTPDGTTSTDGEEVIENSDLSDIVSNASASQVRAGTTENEAYLGSWKEIAPKGAKNNDPKDFIVKSGIPLSIKAVGYVELNVTQEMNTITVTKDAINSGFTDIVTTRTRFMPGVTNVTLTGNVKKTDGSAIDPHEITAFVVENVTTDVTLQDYADPTRWICNIGSTDSYSSLMSADGTPMCDFINGDACNPIVGDERLTDGNYRIFGEGYKLASDGVTREQRSSSVNYKLFPDNSGFAICTSNNSSPQKPLTIEKTVAGVKQTTVEYVGWADADYPESGLSPFEGTYFNTTCSDVATKTKMKDIAPVIGGIAKYAVVSGFDRKDWASKSFVGDLKYPNIKSESNRSKSRDGQLEICEHPEFQTKFNKQTFLFKSLSNDPKAHFGFNGWRHIIENNVRNGVWKAIIRQCGIDGAVEIIAQGNAHDDYYTFMYAETWLSIPFLAYKLLAKSDNISNDFGKLTNNSSCGIGTSYTEEKQSCANGTYIKEIVRQEGGHESGFCGIKSNIGFAPQTKMINSLWINYDNIKEFPVVEDLDIFKNEEITNYDFHPVCIVQINNETTSQINVDDARSWRVYPKPFGSSTSVKIKITGYNEKDDIDDRRGNSDDGLGYMYHNEVPQRAYIYGNINETNTQDRYLQYNKKIRDDQYDSIDDSEKNDIKKKLGHYGWCYERSPCIMPARRCDSYYEAGPGDEKEYSTKDVGRDYMKDTGDIVCRSDKAYGKTNQNEYDSRAIEYVTKKIWSKSCGNKNQITEIDTDNDQHSAIYCNTRTDWKPHIRRNVMTKNINVVVGQESREFCKGAVPSTSISGYLFDDNSKTPTISSHNLYCHPNKTRECGIALGFRTYLGEIHRCVTGYQPFCGEKRYTEDQCVPSDLKKDKEEDPDRIFGICARVTQYYKDNVSTKHSVLLGYSSKDKSPLKDNPPSDGDTRNLVTLGQFDVNNFEDRAQMLDVSMDGTVNRELVDMNHCGVCLKDSNNLENGLVKSGNVLDKKSLTDCTSHDNDWIQSFSTSDKNVVIKGHGDNTVDSSLGDVDYGLNYSVSYVFLPVTRKSQCGDSLLDTTSFYNGVDTAKTTRDLGIIRPMNGLSYDTTYNLGSGIGIYSGRLDLVENLITIKDDFVNARLSMHLAGEGSLIGTSSSVKGFKDIQEGSSVTVQFRSSVKSENGKYLFLYIQGLDDEGKPDPLQHPMTVFPTKKTFDDAINVGDQRVINFQAYNDGGGNGNLVPNRTGKIWAIVYDKVPVSNNIETDGKYIKFDTEADPMSDEYANMSVAADGSNVLGYNSGFYEVQLRVPLESSGVNIVPTILGENVEDAVDSALYAGQTPSQNSAWNFAGTIKQIFFGPIDTSDDKKTCKTYVNNVYGQAGTTQYTTSQIASKNADNNQTHLYNGMATCVADGKTNIQYDQMKVSSYNDKDKFTYSNSNKQRYFCDFPVAKLATKVCQYKRTVNLTPSANMCGGTSNISLGIKGLGTKVNDTATIKVRNISDKNPEVRDYVEMAKYGVKEDLQGVKIKNLGNHVVFFAISEWNDSDFDSDYGQGFLYREYLNSDNKDVSYNVGYNGTSTQECAMKCCWDSNGSSAQDGGTYTMHANKYLKLSSWPAGDPVDTTYTIPAMKGPIFVDRIPTFGECVDSTVSGKKTNSCYGKIIGIDQYDPDVTCVCKPNSGCSTNGCHLRADLRSCNILNTDSLLVTNASAISQDIVTFSKNVAVLYGNVQEKSVTGNYVMAFLDDCAIYYVNHAPEGRYVYFYISFLDKLYHDTYSVPVYLDKLVDYPIKLYNGTALIAQSGNQAHLQQINKFTFKPAVISGNYHEGFRHTLDTARAIEGYYDSAGVKFTVQQIQAYKTQYGENWYTTVPGITVKYQYDTKTVYLPNETIIKTDVAKTDYDDMTFCYQNPGADDVPKSEKIITPVGGNYDVEYTLTYMMDTQDVAAGKKCDTSIAVASDPQNPFILENSYDVEGKPFSADKDKISQLWLRPSCTEDSANCYIDSVKQKLGSIDPFYMCELKQCIKGQSTCTGVIYTIDTPPFPKKYGNCATQSGQTGYSECSIFRVNTEKIDDFKKLKSCIYKNVGEKTVTNGAIDCWVDTLEKEIILASVIQDNDFARSSVVEAPSPPKEIKDCAIEATSGTFNCTLVTRKFTYDPVANKVTESFKNETPMRNITMAQMDNGEIVNGEYRKSAISIETMSKAPIYQNDNITIDKSKCVKGLWGYDCQDPENPSGTITISTTAYNTNYTRYTASLTNFCKNPGYITIDTTPAFGKDGIFEIAVASDQKNVKLMCVYKTRKYEEGFIFIMIRGIVQSLVYNALFYICVALYFALLGRDILEGKVNISPTTLIQKGIPLGIVIAVLSPTGWQAIVLLGLDFVMQLSDGLNQLAVSVMVGDSVTNGGNYAYQAVSLLDEIFATIINGHFFIKILAAIPSMPYGTGIILSMTILSASVQTISVLMKLMIQYMSWLIMLSIYMSILPIAIIFYLFESYKSVTVKWFKAVMGGTAEIFFVFLAASVFSLFTKYVIQGLIYKKICWREAISLPIGDIVKVLTNGVITFVPNIPLFSFWTYSDTSAIGNMVGLINGTVNPNDIVANNFSAAGSGASLFVMVFDLMIFNGIAEKMLTIIRGMSSPIGGGSMTGALDGLAKKIQNTVPGLNTVKSMADGSPMQGAGAMVGAGMSKLQASSQQFRANQAAKLQDAKKKAEFGKANDEVRNRFTGKNAEKEYDKAIAKAKATAGEGETEETTKAKARSMLRQKAENKLNKGISSGISTDMLKNKGDLTKAQAMLESGGDASKYLNEKGKKRVDSMKEQKEATMAAMEKTMDVHDKKDIGGIEAANVSEAKKIRLSEKYNLSSVKAPDKNVGGDTKESKDKKAATTTKADTGGKKSGMVGKEAVQKHKERQKKKANPGQTDVLSSKSETGSDFERLFNEDNVKPADVMEQERNLGDGDLSALFNEGDGGGGGGDSESASSTSSEPPSSESESLPPAPSGGGSGSGGGGEEPKKGKWAKFTDAISEKADNVTKNIKNKAQDVAYKVRNQFTKKNMWKNFKKGLGKLFTS